MLPREAAHLLRQALEARLLAVQPRGRRRDLAPRTTVVLLLRQRAGRWRGCGGGVSSCVVVVVVVVVMVLARRDSWIVGENHLMPGGCASTAGSEESGTGGRGYCCVPVEEVW